MLVDSKGPLRKDALFDLINTCLGICGGTSDDVVNMAFVLVLI